MKRNREELGRQYRRDQTRFRILSGGLSQVFRESCDLDLEALESVTLYFHDWTEALSDLCSSRDAYYSGSRRRVHVKPRKSKAKKDKTNA